MSGSIQTVLGKVDADKLGRVLVHEHIGSVYGGWGKHLPEPNPDWERVIFEHYTPLLEQLVRDHDCRTIVEVSPSWGGYGKRDLEVWAELSRRTGINIVATSGHLTGYSDLPPYFHDSTPEQLADEFIHDIQEGAHGTNIKTGMLKAHIRDDADGRKLLKAIAIAQKETGVPVTTCTSNQRLILDFLEGAGVAPEKVHLSHIDSVSTIVSLLDILRHGCTVNFTIWGVTNPRTIGWGRPVLPKYYSAELLTAAIAEGYVDQVMIAMDYSAMSGFEGNRLLEDLYEIEDRTYLYIFTHVLPMLKKFGVSDADIETMLCVNPPRMLLPT